MSLVEVATPATSVLEKRALIAQEEAIAIVVADDNDYESAAIKLRGVKALDKEIAEFFAPHVKRAHQAHKALKDSENALRDPLKKALDHIGRVMGKYQADLEQQRKLEREMLLAEQKRIMDESAMELAEGLAENGQVEAAEAVLEQAAKLQLEVNCESFALHVRGTAVMTSWKYEIVNEAELPRKYLIPNESMIAAEVRTCKDATVIPGVRVFSETKVGARA